MLCTVGNLQAHPEFTVLQSTNIVAENVNKDQELVKKCL